MNAAAHGVEGNANSPVLYMALELSNTTWKVVFGDAEFTWVYANRYGSRQGESLPRAGVIPSRRDVEG